MKPTTTILALFLGSAVPGLAATIAFQAEDGTFSASPTFNVVLDTAASGGQAITPSDNSRSATARYSLNVITAGDYTLYARFKVPSGDPANDDSFFAPANTPDANGNFTNASVSVNGLQNSTLDTYMWVNTNTRDIIGGGTASDGTSTGLYTLPVGTLDFVIGAREDGIFLDGFVLDTNGSATATELDAALDSVPEPSSTAIFAALAGFALLRRRR